MAKHPHKPTDGRISLAKALVAALQRGDEQQADRILTDIGWTREALLFHEVGRLTRQLHDSLAGFARDSKLAELTEKDIPNAKERLNYVIAMTEQAANTTLNAVESLLPLAENLSEQADELAGRWQRFRQRELPVEEFRRLSQNLADYFEDSQAQLRTLRNGLTDVLMAQGFQDLTGQIIRGVITLVQDLESSLVQMIRLSGQRFRPADEPAAAAPKDPGGPAVPGLDRGAVSSQDEVDALLSSLGF